MGGPSRPDSGAHTASGDTAGMKKIAAASSELVGTKVRYSGLSVIYQASAIIAGFVPAFFTWLLGKSGGAAWPIASIVVAVALLAIWCVARLTRLSHDEVTGYAAAVREDH